MKGAVERFDRRDWVIAIFLFVLAFALRVPFRSQLPYHWDGAQFALAISQYDIRLSQPHAPGYFLYVMLGRLMNQLVGNPHASLVWMSVLFGSALPAIVYLLGAALFGRWAGATAGLLALTSPQAWFHSSVALTYVVDSFLICVLVLVLWRAMQRGGKWQDAVFIGALLAMIGGVRQQSTPALLPLVLFSCWRFKEARLAKLGVTATVTIGFGLLWFVPMVWMCGGMGTYLEIVRLHAQFNAPATVWGGGIEAFLNNVAGVTGFCWNGLVLAAGVLGAALLYRAFGMTAQRKRQWDEKHASALMVLAIWIAPMVAVGTVIGFTKQPGYVLSYLPGWFVLTGAAVASLKGGFRKAVVISAVCAVNVVAFIAWPLQWNGVFFGARLTAHEIKDHDTRLSQMISEIRRRWRPNEVVICHADEFYLYGLKHFQLCLPEYDNYQLATDSTVPHPAGKPLWRTRDSHLEFVNGVNLDGTKGLVLLVPPDEGTDIFAPYFPVKEAIHVGDGESGLFFLPAEKLEQ